MITVNLRDRKLESMEGNMEIDVFLTKVLRIKKVKHSYKNYLGLCPFHSDQMRSFGVSMDYPHKWGCMTAGCEAGLSLESLVRKVLDVGQREAEDIMEKYLGYTKNVSERWLDIPYYDEEKETNIYEDQLLDYSCGYTIHPYFTSRGFTKETGYLMEVGYDKWKKRIVFPVYDEGGALINFVGRTVLPNVEPKYLIYDSSVDRTTFMYGLHLLPEKVPYIVLYEGLLETGYSHQCRVPYAVSLLGAYIHKNHIDILLRYTDTFVLFLDNDDAGKATTEKAVKYIREMGGQVRLVRHLSHNKKKFKDAVDYKSPKILRMMINLALRDVFRDTSILYAEGEQPQGQRQDRRT